MPVFFFSSRRRHTRLQGDWSSDVCSSDLLDPAVRYPHGVYIDAPHRLALIAGQESATLGVLDLQTLELRQVRSGERRVWKGLELGRRRVIKKKRTRSEVRRVGTEWRSRWR